MNTTTLLLIVVSLLPLLAGCEKARLDQQVKELCAKDGGVKVYETVKLPPDKFDQWGRLTFYKPTQGANALGLEYVLKEEDYYYRRGNPEMWRTHTQIFRRSDMKLLSESVIYIRRGGDMPGPWHDSSFSCPEPKDISLIENTFVKSKAE
jgi:hypothetical protein